MRGLFILTPCEKESVMGRGRIDWWEDPYYYYPYRRRPQYGALSFMGDCFMFILTGGLWLIWIIVREMRRR
jgi:hypothetical protein